MIGRIIIGKTSDRIPDVANPVGCCLTAYVCSLPSPSIEIQQHFRLSKRDCKGHNDECIQAQLLGAGADNKVPWLGECEHRLRAC